MLLLRTVAEDALDQGYRRAAARRTAGERAGSHGKVLLVLGLLAVGLLLATALVQTRDRASATARARDALTREIEDRTSAVERIERSLSRTRDAVARDRSAALGLSAAGGRLAQRLQSLESATGAGPVSGPGLSLVLTDAPATEGTPREETDGRVSDRDLQTVVNELWAAGAEAVAVNGQRLTALSAIRSAGEAVLVDYRPLNPPYEVRAVGPPDLQATFFDGFGGSYLQVLRDYGIDYAVSDEDEVVLPASAGLTLRYATAPQGIASESTVSPVPEESTP